MKLGECIQVDPFLRFMGPIGSKVIEYRGQRSNLCFFSVSSKVLGLIFTKLGGKVEGGPGY